jgi:hypothetical protein
MDKKPKRIIVDGREWTVRHGAKHFKGIGRVAIESAIDIREEWRLSDLIEHARLCRLETLRKRKAGLNKKLNRIPEQFH